MKKKTKTHLVVLRKRAFYIAILPFVFGFLEDSTWAKDRLQLLTLKNYSRISIALPDSKIPIEMTHSKAGFEILMRGMTLSDLALTEQLSQQKRWVSELKNLKDQRLKSLDLKETDQGLLFKGVWNFPSGRLALAHPEMEFFDYSNKESSRYFLDFWVKEGPTALEDEEAQKKAKIVAHFKKLRLEEQDRQNRKLATEKAHAAAENWTYFCQESLSDQNDLFLKFYPIHKQIDFSKWVPSASPDAGFKFYKPSQKSKEANLLRFALKLYDDSNYALTLKTLEFFHKEFPQTAFKTEIKFLKLSALYRLGYVEDAEPLLNEVATNNRKSPEALQSALFLAGRSVRENQSWRALQNFYWLIRHYSDHRLSWMFHLGAAESLYFLNNTERAAKEYRWVFENAPSAHTRAEALNRMGDLYLNLFQYEQALATYHQAEHYNQNEIKQFPSFFLNRGESLYQLGRFDEAKKVFDEFLSRYATHPEGWRATFRLGEIAARKPFTEQDSRISRQWFYDTINRYPFSTGALLSRMRLAPCGDHGGFNYASLERFYSEQTETLRNRTLDPHRYYKNDSVSYKNYADFKRLTFVRSLLSLASPDIVFDKTIEELEHVKSPFATQEMSKIAYGFLKKQVMDLLAQGKGYEALSFYSEKSKALPRLQEEVDRSYLILLAQVASEYGLGKWSSELFSDYSKQGKLLQDREKFDEDKVAQMDRSEAAYIQAMGIWLTTRLEVPPEMKTSGKKKDKKKEEVSSDQNSAALPEEASVPDLEKGEEENKKRLAKIEEGKANRLEIRKLLSSVIDESRFSYNRELLLGILDEEEGKIESAIAHGARAQLLGTSRQLDAWLAGLYEKAKKPLISLALYKSVEENNNSTNKEEDKSQKNYSSQNNIQQIIENLIGIPFVPSTKTLILKQGRILEDQKMWGEAAATYSRAIDSGLKNNQIYYEYAKNLMRTEDPEKTKKAEETLENIVAKKDVDTSEALATGVADSKEKSTAKPSDSSEAFWKKLAKETLDNRRMELSVKKSAKEGN